MKVFNKVVKATKKNVITPVNVITNMFGYLCNDGKRQRLEKKIKDRLFNRSIMKKNTIFIKTCVNKLLSSSTPYIKVKAKKSTGRNRSNVKNKKLFVSPINRLTSIRKIYIGFSSIFKSGKSLNKPFITRLETEFESIYQSNIKSNQTTNKYVLLEKRDQLHKSAFKFIPKF